MNFDPPFSEKLLPNFLNPSMSHMPLTHSFNKIHKNVFSATSKEYIFWYVMVWVEKECVRKRCSFTIFVSVIYVNLIVEAKSIYLFYQLVSLLVVLCMRVNITNLPTCLCNNRWHRPTRAALFWFFTRCAKIECLCHVIFIVATCLFRGAAPSIIQEWKPLSSVFSSFSFTSFLSLLSLNVIVQSQIYSPNVSIV